jgi:hypothetical protein
VTQFQPGQRFRTISPIHVTVVWELDTVAILDDYRESCEATLPANESFTIIEIPESGDGGCAACSLDRERELLDVMIPRRRQNGIAFFRLPTPYVVSVRFAAVAHHCVGPLAADDA